MQSAEVRFTNRLGIPQLVPAAAGLRTFEAGSCCSSGRAVVLAAVSTVRGGPSCDGGARAGLERAFLVGDDSVGGTCV